MSAVIEEIYRYQASCQTCGFWGSEYLNEDSAIAEANEHDAEHHPEVTC